MITINYYYVSKVDFHIKRGVKFCSDKRTALRILYKWDKDDSIYISDIQCDDPHDNEWINQRYHLKPPSSKFMQRNENKL